MYLRNLRHRRLNQIYDLLLGHIYCRSIGVEYDNSHDSCPSKSFPLVIEVPIITTEEIRITENRLYSRHSKSNVVLPLQRLQVKKGGLIKAVGVIVR